MALTHTKEEYVRSIYKLAGFERASIRVSDLAEFLGLAKSTVSERLKELISIKFVEPCVDSNGYRLTTKGLKKAKALTYRHRILETFLHTTLNVPEDDVHKEACQLEHGCSDALLERIAAYLGNPTVDPHGQPIEK